jgi:hypothetical protein
MHELLCDNLWNQIQSNFHQSLCEVHQINRNEDFQGRKYTLTDRLQFEEDFTQYVKQFCTFV